MFAGYSCWWPLFRSTPSFYIKTSISLFMFLQLTSRFIEAEQVIRFKNVSAPLFVFPMSLAWFLHSTKQGRRIFIWTKSINSKIFISAPLFGFISYVTTQSFHTKSFNWFLSFFVQLTSRYIEADQVIHFPNASDPLLVFPENLTWTSHFKTKQRLISIWNRTIEWMMKFLFCCGEMGKSFDIISKVKRWVKTKKISPCQ